MEVSQGCCFYQFMFIMTLEDCGRLWCFIKFTSWPFLHFSHSQKHHLKQIKTIKQSMAPVRCYIVNLTLFFSLVLLSILKETTSLPYYVDYDCPESTFAPNSKFQSNLNVLLTDLWSKATNPPPPPGGFYSTSVANTTSDAVYGLFLCRGDQNITGCADCVKMAANASLPYHCPSSKSAVIYFEECTVRYSNESLLGKMTDYPYTSKMNHIPFEGNQKLYFNTMWKTMNESVAETANNRSSKKFTTKMVNVTNSVTLYTLEQCTPDLTPHDCSRCLMNAINLFEPVLGGRVLMPSCRARFESHTFYIGAVNYSLLTPVARANFTNAVKKGEFHRRKKLKLLLFIAIPTSIALLIVVALIGISSYMRRRAALETHKAEIEEIKIVVSLEFNMSTIRTATHNFSTENKLGQGGFGEVYKGKLDGGKDIAVKRLSRNSRQGITEFKTELILVAKLQHKNLVKLLGFCVESMENILVYELLPNSSLDRFLFDPVKKASLDWQTRFKIIFGIARGLIYLHEESRLKVIHRDLKPSNILLDEAMNPKISDFGLAKLFGMDETHGDTKRIVGTYGYMAPEYAITGHYSAKSDVYSFGVIMLEIISGQRNRHFGRPWVEKGLLNQAWTLWNEARALDLVDPSLCNNFTSDDVTKCIHIGLLCVQEEVVQRPNMSTIISVLTGKSISLTTPKLPRFLGGDNNTDIHSSEYAYSGAETITDVYSRE